MSRLVVMRVCSVLILLACAYVVVYASLSAYEAYMKSQEPASTPIQGTVQEKIGVQAPTS